MTRNDLRKFQRQELTMSFANGRVLTAPMAHWLGALLATLDQATMNKVVDQVVAYRTQPPMQKARLALPPIYKELETQINGET